MHKKKTRPAATVTSTSGASVVSPAQAGSPEDNTTKSISPGSWREVHRPGAYKRVEKQTRQWRSKCLSCPDSRADGATWNQGCYTTGGPGTQRYQGSWAPPPWTNMAQEFCPNHRARRPHSTAGFEPRVWGSFPGPYAFPQRVTPSVPGASAILAKILMALIKRSSVSHTFHFRLPSCGWLDPPSSATFTGSL